MKRLPVHGAVWLSAALLLTACQDGAPAEPEQEAAPSPVAPADLEPVEPPGRPDALADLVVERMREALSVTVRVTVEPEEPESADSAPLEDTEMTLLLSDPPAARMTAVDTSEERPATSNTIVVDDVMYVQLEEEPLVEGKDWMRLTHDEIDAAEDRIGPFAEIFRVIHTETAETLDAASGTSSMDVVRLGEFGPDPATEASEEHGGLTRYKGTTPTADLADAGHEEYADLLELRLDEVSWELLVTGRGLPVEFTVGMVTPDGEDATSTVHYTDWGADVEIAAPPEDTVGTIEDSLAGG
jgi:hypothetical protein